MREVQAEPAGSNRCYCGKRPLRVVHVRKAPVVGSGPRGVRGRRAAARRAGRALRQSRAHPRAEPVLPKQCAVPIAIRGTRGCVDGTTDIARYCEWFRKQCFVAGLGVYSVVRLPA